MKSICLPLLFTGSLLTGQPPSGTGLPMANPGKIGVSDVNLADMNAMIQAHIDKGEVGGVVTLVARHGKVAQLKAYGMMDIEGKRPMRTDALFRIASMNKVLTSVTALTLYEQGRFQLDEPVSKYIPELKNLRVVVSNVEKDPKRPLETVPAAREMSIRDLFRHTSGFLYTMGETPLDKRYLEAGFRTWDKSLKAFVQKLSELPLAYQPGTRWEYSYSIDVLGYLVEVLSGKTLSQAMKERVLTPLRMKDTDFFVPPGKRDRLTNHYVFEQGKLRCVEAASTSPFLKLPPAFSGGGGWFDGCGGVVSTAPDLARFLQMILNHGELEGARVLRPDTVALMTSDQISSIKDRGFKVSGYGLGVGVTPEGPDATRSIQWSGGPYNTFFKADLKNDMIAIFLMQNEPWMHLGLISRFGGASMACALAEDAPSSQEPLQK